MNNETTKASFRDRKIGEMAVTVPGATAVFRKHRLDFCCGGDLTLTEAASKRGLDVADLSP